MKKITLLAFFIPFFACNLNAQKIQFYNEDKTTISPDTMVLYAPEADSTYQLNFWLKNTTTTEDLNLLMRCTYIPADSDFGGNFITFCIGDACETAPATTSAPYRISSESFSDLALYIAFVAIHDSLGGRDGTFYGKIEFLNNITQQVVGERTVRFIRGINSSIKNIYSKPETKLEIFPNPASDQIKIKYDLSKVTTSNNLVIIRNLVGAVIKTVQLPADSKEIALSVSDLNSGVYFYSLSLDGIVQNTKKLIIRR